MLQLRAGFGERRQHLVQLAHGNDESGAALRRVRWEWVSEKRARAFGCRNLVAAQDRYQDFVIAADLDEADALVDQPWDHVGEDLIALGDEDSAVVGEVAFEESVRFGPHGFADRTLGPDMDVE